MNTAALTTRGGAFTAHDLRAPARSLHRPRVAVVNAGQVCVIAALGLSLLGIVTMAAAAPSLAVKQIAYLCVAVVAGAATAVPHYRWLQRFSVPLSIAVLAMLVFLLIPFIPESIVRLRNGARRWISLGVTIQPSELAKIAYVIALASYLRYRKNYRRLGGLLLPFALTFVPMVLVLVEPDLGTALLFVPALFAMLLAAGARLRHLALVIVLGLAAIPVVSPMLRPHQVARIKAFYSQIKGDSQYVQGIGLQGDRAMTLVGAGRLVGVGREKATDLARYNGLPEKHNDMIFAVIACRWGALGAIVTWGLFGLFCLGGLATASQCKDPFGRLVAVGIVAMVFAQMAINTGMTLGLAPITGMTLPFVSSGGSSLVAAWIMVGLLVNVAMRRPLYLARESFDFDHEEAGG